MDERAVIQILLQGNYLSQEDLKRAQIANHNRGSLITTLLNEGIITRNTLGQAIAEYLKLPYADLAAYPPPAEQVLKIPKEVAEHYSVVVFHDQPDKVIVATSNSQQPELLSRLQQTLGKPVTLAYALAEDIKDSFIHYLPPLGSQIDAIIKGKDQVVPKIIDQIFSYAQYLKTSDIHLEPQDKTVIIRFRVDGVLQEVGQIDKTYYDNVINRVKVQAHLRIDEHYSAQDGALRHTGTDGNIVDLRVSIVPTLDGEKIVFRVLSKYVRDFTMQDLGLNPRDEQALVEAAKRPFGMILVTGPTGSGKTTTLYSLIKVLNQPNINITTIEDPVEYKIPGINQIQVNAQTNLTFAQGLRSIIRQDPNVVLVGEIRDQETVDIAVNAALTGQLLLSTFHSNDAASAIPRLLDMGAEPFLVASTLELLIAQRLVRKICLSCRSSLSVTPADLAKMGTSGRLLAGVTMLYRGKGCKNCGGGGFKGRVAIYELIQISKEMEDLILTQPSSSQIWALASKQGSRQLFEDGIDKVKNGLTTIEELLRVARPR